MRTYSSTLQAVVGARTGIAPVDLLDVQDSNGNNYYWSSRPISAASVIDGSTQSYLAWILNVGAWTFHRSMQTDMGTIRMQNISGDTLSRDLEKIVRKSALEGALFVYRYYQADAKEAIREVHGTLSVDDSDPTTVSFTCKQLLNPSADPTPQYQYCEICQWRWSSVQCGSTQTTPCQQSYPTCQVTERIFAITNSYEKNFGEATANVATVSMNRMRRF